MLGLFDPVAAIFVQYYPLNYTLVVVGTPTLMSLLAGRIFKVLSLHLVLHVDCTTAENFDSIEDLDDFPYVEKYGLFTG